MSDDPKKGPERTQHSAQHDEPKKSARKQAKRRVAVVQTGPVEAPPPNPLSPCQKVFARAHTFASLIALIRDAERRLMAAGHLDVVERLAMIRGLFYGTPWSLDYKVEQSAVRNLGFDFFAGFSPADPRDLLQCNLYQALQDSQDIKDGTRHFDFGHLIIGLDARTSLRTRSTPIPAMGGSGLEVSTWLGDLGGGAAMLAFERVANPGARAISRFRGSDYGGSINLEGDVAGFVVGLSGTTLGAPVFRNDSISDAISTYLEEPSWTSRAKTFLRMYGYAAPPDKADLVEDWGEQIESFAVWYLVQRLSSKRKLSPASMRIAAKHVKGAARETALLFFEALERSRTTGGPIEAPSPGPAPSPPGAASLRLEAAATAAEALEATQGALDAVRDWFE